MSKSWNPPFSCLCFRSNSFSVNQLVKEEVGTSQPANPVEKIKEEAAKAANAFVSPMATPKASSSIPVTPQTPQTPQLMSSMMYGMSPNPFMNPFSSGPLPIPPMMFNPELAAALASMNKAELCVICGDKSSGFHYQALSCEGCKVSFHSICRTPSRKRAIVSSQPHCLGRTNIRLFAFLESGLALFFREIIRTAGQESFGKLIVFGSTSRKGCCIIAADCVSPFGDLLRNPVRPITVATWVVNRKTHLLALRVKDG